MKHSCSDDLPSACYGSAITGCNEDDEGYFIVDNGEYCSYVKFCPYCGKKAKNTNFKKLEQRLMEESRKQTEANDKQMAEWHEQYPPGTASVNMPFMACRPNYVAVVSDIDGAK